MTLGRIPVFYLMLLTKRAIKRVTYHDSHVFQECILSKRPFLSPDQSFQRRFLLKLSKSQSFGKVRHNSRINGSGVCKEHYA